MKELQKVYKEYKAAAKAADQAEALWEADCYSEELEAAFDKAYTKQFELMQIVVNQLVKKLNIEPSIARAMMCSEKMDQLMSLRIA